MGEDNQLAESLPAGIITMLLTGYIKTIERLEKLMLAALCGWLITIVAFVIYIYCR